MDITTSHRKSLVLVPGYWLGQWAWDAVARDLRERGHRVDAVTLPGLDPQDPHRTARTLPDQAAALRAVVAKAGEDGSGVVLVVHSGAGAPASLLLDQDSAVVARIIYVDSGPSSDGDASDPSVPPEVQEVALPPFDQLAGSLDGLSERDLELFRRRAVPEPANVMREKVRLRNDSRRDVPSTIIACSFPSQALLQMAREGHPMMAEASALADLEIVDLPTGHWPMWSRPADLAAAIAKAAEGRGARDAAR